MLYREIVNDFSSGWQAAIIALPPVPDQLETKSYTFSPRPAESSFEKLTELELIKPTATQSMAKALRIG